MWKSVLSDTLADWELFTPPSYPWVKKQKFLLKPTYDVGEQN